MAPTVTMTGDFAGPGGTVPARHSRARGLVSLMLGLLLVTGGACAEQPEDELSGPLGPGAGGPAVNQATVVSHDFTDESGNAIGHFAYDGAVLLHYHPDPETPSLHVLATVPEVALLADLADDGILNGLQPEDVVLAITRIVGRADTPCRVQAALLARDENYTIFGSGDRTNDEGLEFHQVNLANDGVPLTQRFYCTQLSGNLGIQVNGTARTEGVQEYRQVHYVLNSIRGQ